MLSIVLTVVGLGLLIAAHEAGHLLLARLMGMRVETYSLGFGPRIWGFTRGGTDYRLSALPLGGYCKIAGFTPDDPAAQDPNDPGSYTNKPAWRRFLVIAAGPGVNYLCAFLLLAILYSAVGTPVRGHVNVAVQPDGPAAAAGLQTGDEVLAIDGARVHSLGEVIGVLHAANAPAVRQFELLRKGQPLMLTVTPVNGKIQVGPLQTYARAPFGEALSQAGQEIVLITRETLAAFWNLLHFRGGSALSGPIGIVKQGAAQVERGMAEFVALLALISVDLAIFNFLPVPALDGGRLVFLGYELITRKRVNHKAETVVHLVGFLLLFGLIVAVTVFGDLQLGKKLFHRG